MIFGSPYVPTLLEISFVEIAVRISNVPETMDFMKKYGPVCFIFPSNELRAYINKEIPESSLQIKLSLCMTERKEMLIPQDPTNESWRKFVKFYNDFCSSTDGFTLNNLPSTMWEVMILKKISCLDFPNSLRNKLMPIIRCICLEIYRWYMEHEEYTFGFENLDIQKYFCWNSYGKIDRIKTAKSLINNESLSVSARYNLARNYGFERDFLFLWDKMSIAEKDYSKQMGGPFEQQAWFEYGVTGSVENSIQISQDACGNPLNFRLFFSLLSPTQKVEWYKVFINLKAMDYADVRFCLSLLEKNEQENILREYSSKILQYYLVWPLQKEFLNVTENVWPYMSIENYINLAKFIIFERILIGWKDFNYVWLMQELWRQTPNTFKELAKTDKVYQFILPVINCEQNKGFPKEGFLEKYKGKDLEFHHVGINYNLSRDLFLVDPIADAIWRRVFY
ncbi:uncharacterized protein TNCT_245051 [Trichonephila clavata]|uniref:Uncharacterized protein n=1 Tax=Trichonephila clavata TaxID=2740835 RepID=A0A8X6EZC1_TRICU|nr:uncharacterized protein TNCT_245051 [Trichonephila clavata]